MARWAAFGIPVSALIMLILFVIFVFISRKTAFGRSVLPPAGMRPPRSFAGLTLSGCVF